MTTRECIRENLAQNPPLPPQPQSHPDPDYRKKALPHNDDAEAWIIGACLRHPKIAPLIMDVLPVRALYSIQKQYVLQAIYDLVSRGDAPSLIGVTDLLRRKKEFGVALPLGEIMLMDWIDRVVSPIGAKPSARIVLEYWIGRETIHLTRKLHDLSWDIAADYPKALAMMRDLARDLVDKTQLLDRLIASEDLR